MTGTLPSSAVSDNSSPIRIALADDHPVLREGIKSLLRSEPDFEIVGEADDGAAAVALAAKHEPDVLVLDVSLPVLSGVEVTKQVLTRRLPTRILALTAHEDFGLARTLLDAGAAGYAHKRSACNELVRAVRLIAAGEIYVDPEVADSIPKRPSRAAAANGLPVITLSEREASVLRLVTRGHTAKEISSELGLSPRTLETYKARAMSKLHLHSRADLIRYAMSCGWLREP